MNPIIFMVPAIDLIQIDDSNLIYDFQPSPKLIKYGFNNINEQLDIMSLTSNPYYRVGLNFDFERNDDQSITKIGSKFFNYDKFDKTYAELWEIISNFKLLDNNKSISTSHTETITNIATNYQKLRANNKKYDIVDIESDKKVDLIIDKISDVDIDENAVVQYILLKLHKYLEKQSIGSSMVLEMFGTQTQVTIELIYYLSSLYTQAYIIRPIISSDFSDEKYLVLINLREKNIFPKIISSDDTYIVSLNVPKIPTSLTSIVQCINSYIMPKKYNRYKIIKNYLDTKVYEGATYQDMINAQNKNTQNWMDIYTNIDRTNKILDENIEYTSKNCSIESNLNNYLN
ncbi:putative FtsJ-like methyltransferase [Megavirus lba]|uniref:Putative FtsJ-like methyltransferase n=1 Tax=Megavirus lba TaxID=1235314 RepID=L7Y634_9VIRU|nr:putative FtsJ-like methyltransferase [Megavirus lba]